MAARTNTIKGPGVRAPGSRPAGSSAYPRDGRVDSLAVGVDPRVNYQETDRSTIGNGKPYVIPTNAR